MKLKDVYITWKGDRGKARVTIVAKALGIPYDADNYIDPSLWDQSNLYRLFFQWFEAFACGHWDLPTVEDPGDLYDELCKIDEFDKLIEGRLLQKKYKGEGYDGDSKYIEEIEMEEFAKRFESAA